MCKENNENYSKILNQTNINLAQTKVKDETAEKAIQIKKTGITLSEFSLSEKELYPNIRRIYFRAFIY